MREIPIINSNKVALVDDEDYARCSRFNWYFHGGRVFTRRPNITLARMVTNDHISPIIDHKDRDGLNNQKNNLRSATYQQNSQNQDKEEGFWSSKYKGVCYIPNRKRFIAYAKNPLTKKNVHLGYFKNEVKAAEAYDNYAKKHYGEFACLNFLKGDPK